MSHRWVYSVATVETSSSEQAGGDEIQSAELLAIADRPVLPGQRHQHRAALDGGDAGGEQHVRRADDLDVQPVGVVPPVVEGGGREHRERPPDAHPGPKRRAESPESYGRGTVFGRSGKGRP